MLLPSPTQATFRSVSAPKCSSMVMRSLSTWQGWCVSVRPLITGMVAWRASSATVSWAKVRTTTPSTYRDNTRAVSATGSFRDIWVWPGAR